MYKIVGNKKNKKVIDLFLEINKRRFMYNYTLYIYISSSASITYPYYYLRGIRAAKKKNIKGCSLWNASHDMFTLYMNGVALSMTPAKAPPSILKDKEIL